MSNATSSFAGSAAHGGGEKWRAPETASLYHAHNGCPSSLFLSSQQSLPQRQCAPPSSCHSLIWPTPPLHVHHPHCPGIHWHCGTSGGIAGFSTPCSAARRLSTKHRAPGTREHGSPRAAVAHTAPRPVSAPVCPPNLHQRFACLHCLHWISLEPHQDEPIPVSLDPKTLEPSPTLLPVLSPLKDRVTESETRPSLAA